MDIRLNRQIVLMIRALYFSITEEWANISKKYNLSSAQQHLLFILSSSVEPLTITEISHLGCWHISTVTRLLQPLLNREYISITNGKGKSKHVRLTESGKLKLKSIAEDVFQRENFPLNVEGITDEFLEEFAQIGMQIIKNQKGKDLSHWITSSEPKAMDI